MARFFRLLILVPIAIVIVAFALANRHSVTVAFDPFSDPATSPTSIKAPLFIVLFVVLIVGTFLGGAASWIKQGTHRRRARDAQDDAERWRDEVRRMREQPPLVASSDRALARH